MRYRGKTQDRTKTVNLAGGEAFQESPKLELVSLLLTSFVQDKFYRKADADLARLRSLSDQLPDKKFLAKAAIYARQEYGMRSITHAMATELCRVVKGEQWTKDAVTRILRRPDDLLETLSYWMKLYGKPIPNAMKKGMAQKLASYDRYQLAKYRGERSDLKMVDLFNLIHPSPVNGQEKLFADLMNGSLKSTDTWEAKLTEAGKAAESEEDKQTKKVAAWGELIEGRKIGYFALLRNLRNIFQQADGQTRFKALEMLVDEKLIRKSLVMPFRFLTAMQELEQSGLSEIRDIAKAVGQAIDISMANVPRVEGRTLVALDTSGSMRGKPAQIGALFAAVLYKSNSADLLTFSDTARIQNLNPLDSVMTIASRIQFEYGGTNFSCIFEQAGRPYDRIVILSDMQGWKAGSYYNTSNPGPAFQRYKLQYQADPHVFSFDLQGYGTLMFPERNVYCLAGFSEKVFDVMKMLEQDRNALVHTIEGIDL